MGTPQHRYSAEYFRKRERSPTFRLELAAFQRVLDKAPDRGNPVLEAGAGSGVLALRLASAERSVVAADIDAAPMRHLNETQASALQCDVGHLPIADRSVGAVVAQHVIEHFADPVAILKEWRRVLRPGGVCIVTTPNRNFPDQSWFADPTHAELFDQARLRSVFAEAGFARPLVRPLVPWLGSMRAVFMSARIHRLLLGVPVRSRRSLNLLGIGVASAQ